MRSKPRNSTGCMLLACLMVVLLGLGRICVRQMEETKRIAHLEAAGAEMKTQSTFQLPLYHPRLEAWNQSIWQLSYYGEPDEVVPHLKHHRNLRWLTLHSARELDGLGRLPSLTGLDLTYYWFEPRVHTTIFEGSLANIAEQFPKLNVLRVPLTDVQAEQLAAQPESWRTGVTALENTWGSRLTCTGLTTIIHAFPHLKSIDLSYSDLSHTDLSCLKKFPHIQNVQLAGTHADIEVFRDCDLEYLDLARNNYTATDIDVLRGSRIRNLNLSVNPALTDDVIPALLEIHDLEVINIQYTPITSNGLARLRAHPTVIRVAAP